MHSYDLACNVSPDGQWLLDYHGEDHPDARCPECVERPLDRRGYSYLLGLYLGDGHIKKRTMNLACCNDYPGLMDDAEQALKIVLPFATTSRWQRRSWTEVVSYSHHWTCLFPQHGPGRKHTRRVELTGWQSAIVEDFPQEFVRGLIHSDGCRSEYSVKKIVRGEPKSYRYTRYSFSNRSEDIHGLYQWSLDLIGVEWIRASFKHTDVNKRASVARLDAFVGPKY